MLALVALGELVVLLDFRGRVGRRRGGQTLLGGDAEGVVVDLVGLGGLLLVPVRLGRGGLVTDSVGTGVGVCGGGEALEKTLVVQAYLRS